MLIITQIKSSRIPNRVNIVFSDNSYLPLFIDDVVKLKLSKGQSLDQNELDLISQHSQKYLGKEFALRQIAFSPKTEKILSQKLKLFFQKNSRRFPNFSKNNFPSVVDEIITELKSKNFINPANFVDYFINKHKSKSRSQVKFLLAQQGVNLSDFSINIPHQNDLISIQKILIKKKVTKNDLSDFKTKSKILSALYRRGFEINDIQSAIDDYLKLK